MTSLFWQTYQDGKYNAETVTGGFDRTAKKKLYVVRGEVNGETIPGYLQDGEMVSCVGNGGKVNYMKTYEVLVNPQDVYLEWIVPRGDTIPTGAVVGGFTKDGGKIFIARGKYDGDWVPGKMIPTDGQDFCYICCGGMERKITDFEVMCINTVTPQSRVQ